MGVLYDYFRSGGTESVAKLMAGTGGESPLTFHGGQIDGVDAKGIEPTVSLGKFIAMILDVEWTPELVAAQMVWPRDLESDESYEGPWVVDVGEAALHALAGLDAARIPALSQRWAQIEEFGGHADPEFLAEVLEELAALARRASAESQHLYC